MRRSRTLVVSAASLLVLIAAVAFASAPVHRPFVREDKALEHVFRGDAPMAKGAMKPIASTDVSALAAPGWAGEIKLGAEDTWEPSIAADPSGPWVYAMYNGFNRPKACKNCPPIPMLLRVSSDNGVDVGTRDLPLPVPGREAVPVRPGGEGREQRRRVRDVDEQVRDRLLEVHEPRRDVDRPDQGVGQPVGRQAVDRRQPQRRGRLRRVRDEPGRVDRGVAQLGRLVRAGRQPQHRQRQLPLPERSRGAAERRRRHVGVDVPGQPAGQRPDRDRDVAHHERRHVVDA